MKFIIGFKENAILKNGIELEYSDDNVNEFKALNEIDKNLNARDVCPIQELCDYNNCFDCDVYGMFSGCCFTLNEAIDFCKELRELRKFKEDAIIGLYGKR